MTMVNSGLEALTNLYSLEIVNYSSGTQCQVGGGGLKYKKRDALALTERGSTLSVKIRHL